MDQQDVFWSWMNGLVRRASLGVLFFLLFSVASLLIVISSVVHEGQLENLEAFSQLHERYVEAFNVSAASAAQLAGARAGALEAVQPLRQALLSPKTSQPHSLACADEWQRGLGNLQRVAQHMSNACPPDLVSPSGSECSISRNDVRLSDMTDFDEGVASGQEMLLELDQACFTTAIGTPVCNYYVEHREDTIASLRDFVETLPRQSLTSKERALLAVPAEPSACSSQNTFLATSRGLVSAIDLSARPRTVSDFERLGQTISARRVALDTEPTSISAAPAGGLVTIAISRDLGLPILHVLALIAALYAFLNIRRLDRLVAATPLPSDSQLYRLYPLASHVFTAPVFGERREGKAISAWSKLAGYLVVLTFSWIPSFALGICALPAIAYAFWTRDHNGFSTGSLITAIIVGVLEVIVIVAYELERRALRAAFNYVADPTLPVSTSPTSGGTP